MIEGKKKDVEEEKEEQLAYEPFGDL